MNAEATFETFAWSMASGWDRTSLPTFNGSDDDDGWLERMGYHPVEAMLFGDRNGTYMAVYEQREATARPCDTAYIAAPMFNGAGYYVVLDSLPDLMEFLRLYGPIFSGQNG